MMFVNDRRQLLRQQQYMSDVKEFFQSDPEYFRAQLKRFFTQFGLSTEDLRNLSVSAAALTTMLSMADKPENKSTEHPVKSDGDCGGGAGLTDKMIDLKRTVKKGGEQGGNPFWTLAFSLLGCAHWKSESTI